jgi:glycosyltransferase involved in cell wall biosynthesis
MTKLDLCRFDLEESVDKPVVFVLPTFIAVGGVERNTIGIINNLKTKYDFIVVNFERLSQQLGSLHSQYIPSCKAVYDLTELSVHDDILCYLEALKKVYQPVLVWICNGSPWLAENTLNIRNLFHDCAIVDQQVYDVNEGWINIFDDEGIHSYDRFIAINSKIKNEFINHKGIDESKIDLIHPVIKSERFNRALYRNNIKKLEEKYNISKVKRNYVFVGRMADQKRPLLFLEMIARLRVENKDYNFIMVGDGPLSDDVNEFIDRNCADRVQRIKYIDNMAELYAIVDGLVITSKFEGLPIAMLEAMCMGLPVFSTNVGDIDKVLDEYKSGMLVPVNCTSVELSDKFIEFDNCLEVYQAYAQRCAEKIRERFSEEAVSSVYDVCFQKALNNAVH